MNGWYIDIGPKEAISVNLCFFATFFSVNILLVSFLTACKIEEVLNTQN